MGRSLLEACAYALCKVYGEQGAAVMHISFDIVKRIKRKSPVYTGTEEDAWARLVTLGKKPNAVPTEEALLKWEAVLRKMQLKQLGNVWLELPAKAIVSDRLCGWLPGIFFLLPSTWPEPLHCNCVQRELLQLPLPNGGEQVRNLGPVR
jgi:hypothetical protein